MVKISLNVKKVNLNLEGIDKSFDLKLWKIGELLVNEVQLKIRQMKLWDTGRFHDSVDFRIVNGEIIIHDGVEYGKYLEYGTIRHFIKPVNKKALHWKDGRKNMFSKGHWVSGIKAYAPFRRGILSSLQGIKRILAERD